MIELENKILTDNNITENDVNKNDDNKHTQTKTPFNFSSIFSTDVSLKEAIILVIPFLNEIMDLMVHAFNLPQWVYNPFAKKINEVLVKMLIDSLSYFGVVLTTIEMTNLTKNYVVVVSVALVVLFASFILTVTFLPIILKNKERPKRTNLFYAFWFILVCYMIEYFSVDYAKHYIRYTGNGEGVFRNKEEMERYYEKSVLYFIFIVLAILPVLYLTHLKMRGGRIVEGILLISLIAGAVAFAEYLTGI